LPKSGIRSGPSRVLFTCNTPEVFYQPGDSLPSLSVLIGDSSPHYEQIPSRVAAALRIAWVYGLRIGEVLRLTWADVLPGDRAFVCGEKGGRGQLIALPGANAQILAAPGLSLSSSLCGCSYTAVYRALVRAGIGRRFGRNRNSSRSHLGRHLTARAVVSQCGRSAGMEALRHKSKDTIDYYLDKEDEHHG